MLIQFNMKIQTLLIILTITLAACVPVATPASTETPTSATALPSFTPSSTLIPATATPLVNNLVIDAWQTQIALATPIRTPVVPKFPHKFPNASIQDGNLYFQSNADLSIQLTKSGEDHDPILSDDGQKIVFFHGKAGNHLYSINSDGSQERILIANGSPLIGNGDIYFPSFMPGTHILLFNTFLCGPKKGLYVYRDCMIGVYSIDTNTRKINPVVVNVSGNDMSTWEVDFEISPNGAYVSVAGEGHVNIYRQTSGQFQNAFQNVLGYHITPPDEYVPQQYWLPDSSGLIIIAPANGEYNEPATPPALYVAYRYTIGDEQAIPIHLDKQILWDEQHDNWCVSPDRKWILFAGNETGDRRDVSLDYLGNLIDGSTQAHEPTWWPLYYCKWSPDSKHFVLSNSTPGFIGSVDGGPLISVNGSFTEWIDASHYYYSVGTTVDTLKTYIGEISGN